MKKKKSSIESGNTIKLKVPNWVLLLLILNLTGIVVIGSFMILNRQKTAFVDLGTLYDGFSLSKQRQTELQTMSFNFKNTLDSMALDIKSLEERLNRDYDRMLEDQLQLKKMNYYRIEENMQAQLKEMKVQSDEQIWQQINTYTQDFGKEKGYDYIYGGNGSGSLMYASNSKDISEDVLVYINKKFTGE